MSLSTKKVVPYNFVPMWTILTCIIVSLSVPCYSSQQTDRMAAKTIVIDPGHGGTNIGAKGRHGTLEKDLSLELSQLIAKRLQQKYHVILTRNNDKDLPLSDRTALANHNKADLFISIHMGGSFRDDTSESIIIYYSPPREESYKKETNVPRLSNNQVYPPEKWQNVQRDHIPASRTLAQKLRLELNKRMRSINPSISASPIFVLSGADMPALYIEPFYLTHPDTEEHYQDDENIDRLANAMAAAIVAAIEKQ